MIGEQILIILIAIDIGIFATLIGVVLGQRSVWQRLKKKDVTIGEWVYAASKTETVKRYWD